MARRASIKGCGSGGAPVASSIRRRRPVAAAVAVDLGPEPGQEGGELALGERGSEVAELGLGAGEELRGVEVAQGIGREVAEQAGAPVNVLEAAVGVVGWGQAEEPAASPRSRRRGRR